MTPLEVSALVVCFLLSIVFSASEAALLSMTTASFNEAQTTYARRASLLEKLLSRPRNLMVTILVANMAANTVLVAIAANNFTARFGLLRGLVLSILVMTAVVALFAEIFPKVLATKFPVWVAMWTAYPVYCTSWLTAPVIAVTDGVLALFFKEGEELPAERNLTEEELKTYLILSKREGVIAASEGEMIFSVFDFSDTIVREVMTPRTEIDALPENASFEDVLEALGNVHRSRIPVYREHLDEVIGVVNAKDLLPFVVGERKSEQFKMAELIRHPFFVPEVMKCDDLLRDLRQRRLTLAIVVDEYGGTAGIITIEDLLEEIFGEIQDETDEEEESKIIPLANDGGWIVDARLHVDEANEDLPLEIPSGEFDTIGGFLFDQIGHLPVIGDEAIFEGHIYKVKEMDGHRISRIEIVPKNKTKKLSKETS